jgi:acyl carrier protein
VPSSTSTVGIDAIRELILELLSSKLGEVALTTADENTHLIGLGLIDSAALLDVIVLVERETGMEFEPEGLDLQDGFTLGQLIASFVPTSVPGASEGRPRLS